MSESDTKPGRFIAEDAIADLIRQAGTITVLVGMLDSQVTEQVEAVMTAVQVFSESITASLIALHDETEVCHATQPTERRPVKFTAGTPLYEFAENADNASVEDHLSARLTQLEALLTTATIDTCEGSSFGAACGDLQNAYLWCCEMLASECRELATRV